MPYESVFFKQKSTCQISKDPSDTKKTMTLSFDDFFQMSLCFDEFFKRHRQTFLLIKISLITFFSLLPFHEKKSDFSAGKYFLLFYLSVAGGAAAERRERSSRARSSHW